MSPSIWNRIGDVASSVGDVATNAVKFAGEVVGGAKGVANFAWDVGTAPWNDADEYNGFVNTFKTAGSQNKENIVKPLASAGGAIMKVPGLQPALERINNINQEYIREPATTYNLVQGDLYAGRISPLEIFDPKTWAKAYKGAQDISFGQSFVGQYRNIYDPKFNIYDPAQREQAFKKSAWGKALSGTADVLIQGVGDVTLAAGKVAKVAKLSTLGVGELKTADDVVKAAEDITKAQYGVNNRFSKVLDDFTDNGSAYAISHPMVKSSNNPGLLAHLLGESVDRDETALVLRSALGDPVAMDELRLQRAYITDALETARGDLSAVDEWKLFSAPDGTGMIPFLTESPAVIEAAKKNYESLAKTDKYFADLMQIGGTRIDEAGNLVQEGGTLTRTTGRGLQGVENLVAQSRAVRFYDKTIGNPNIQVYQPTPFHRLYQKISWAAGERPAGLVDFNDADSYREIIANINRLEKIGVFTVEESKAALDNYMAAATPEARFTATMALENKAMRNLAAKNGVDEEVMNKIYNGYVGARTSALKSVKDNGFMVDLDESIIKVPQLESQSANYLPLMDFDLMNKLMKRSNSELNALKGRAVDTGLHYIDILQDAFKAGALLRLGYTQRNAIDSQLRIAASVGAFATLRHLGLGTKDLINNTIAVPSRLIDRYRPVDSGMTFRQVQEASVGVIKELKELKTNIAAIEAKLSLKPDDLDLAGELNTLKLLQEEKLAVYNHNADVLNRNGYSVKETVISEKEKIKKLNPNLKVNENISLVKTDFIKKFIEFDRTSPEQNFNSSFKTIANIAEDLKSGKGFTNPLRLQYYVDKDGQLYLNLVEGNHRIQAALQSGIKEVPVEVTRSTGGFSNFKLVGEVSKIQPDQFGYTPGNVNPKEILPISAFSLPEKTKNFVAKSGKNRIGTGSYEVTTSDGKKHILHDAFGGPLADMFRRIASSGNSFERLVDSNTDMYMRQLSSKGIQAIKPTDPAYFEQWAQTLRQQFGNSAVVRKIIAGESLDDISTWLRNSPSGRDLRRRLAVDSSDAAEYVTRISGFLDNYLPVESGLRPKLREITANDLRGTFKDPTVLPVIHGNLLDENINNLSRFKGRELINTLFNLLGTLPEDTWARNPLYIYFYRKEAARRVNIVSELKGNFLSTADQEAIMGAAHKNAVREMKKVLFNIERRTNLAAAMKYINPFFSAQENAYKTWTKMAVANPAIVNRGYLVWNAPNQAGLVTDRDGNEVPAGQTSGNDIMWIGLPKGITKIPGLQSLTELGIPKGSLDILFQGGMDVLYMKGNPNVFSDIFPVGPYVAIPASEILKRQPKFDEALKYILPFGPSKDAVSGFLPTWFQKLQTRQAGLDDPGFAKSYQLIWYTEQQKAKRNGQDPVSPSKIMKMTKDYWSMRTAANLIMPFAPQFNSPYKFYLDKSREYKRMYGLDADAKFLNDYPEYFSFSASLSSNPTSVQYSQGAVANLQKYGNLVEKLNDIEPKLIGAIVNNPSGYDFSQAAYDYLYNKKISPNSPQKFLSSQSPAVAQKKNEAEKGWIQYNELSDALEEELQKRGLSSTQQKGAEDLKMLKEIIIRKLSIQTDAEGKPIFDNKTGEYARTAWYDDYLDSDGSKTNRIIAGLGAVINDENYMKDNGKNTTWKSISAYLEFRKVIAKELVARDVKSIDAKANLDLRLIYDGTIKKLKKDDPLGFQYIYDRFLSQDLIYDKYLTPKVPPKEAK